MLSYPRDLSGYNGNPPPADWPGGARVAVQFVLNYEEGGENCMLHGDAASETFLSEIIGAQPFLSARHMSMESIYEYGARAGVWRVLDLFKSRNVPLTVLDGGRAPPGRDRALPRRRPRDCQPRLSLDQLSRHTC